MSSLTVLLHSLFFKPNPRLPWRRTRYWLIRLYVCWSRGSRLPAAAIDGSLILDIVDPGSWTLKGDGTVNSELLRNSASRSLHDMAVVGKVITADFYSRYFCWNGCSAGGRQGHIVAQEYLNDFVWILANAPAIYWSSIDPLGIWPQVVMYESNTFLSLCEHEYFVNVILDVCDMLGGVQDGIILDPLFCHFDPQSLVGSTVTCSNTTVKLTPATASDVQKILSGPRAPVAPPCGLVLLSARNPTSSPTPAPPSPSWQIGYDIPSSSSSGLIYHPSPIQISHGCSPSL